MSLPLARLKTGRQRTEEVWYRKDGTPLYAEALTIALRDEQEEITGYLSIMRDITERKRGQAEFLELKDELDAELSAMSRLHELSTRLFATSELRQVLEEVLDASITLQGADFGNIQLYNRETGKVDIVAPCTMS